MEKPIADWHVVGDHPSSGSRIIAATCVPLLEYFEGHFPGNPVLPAISQLRIVSQILDESESHSLRIGSVPILRLAKTIQPGSPIEISLKITGLQVDCEIRQHGRSATRGRLLMEKVECRRDHR